MGKSANGTELVDWSASGTNFFSSLSVCVFSYVSGVRTTMAAQLQSTKLLPTELPNVCKVTPAESQNGCGTSTFVARTYDGRVILIEHRGQEKTSQVSNSSTSFSSCCAFSFNVLLCIALVPHSGCINTIFSSDKHVITFAGNKVFGPFTNNLQRGEHLKSSVSFSCFFSVTSAQSNNFSDFRMIKQRDEGYSFVCLSGDHSHSILTHHCFTL